MEEKKAVLSRIKFESALEIQGLTVTMSELNDKLASKQNECSALMQNINSLQEQHELEARDAARELEALSQRHQNELDECKRLHDEEIQQMKEDVERIGRERDNIASTNQERIDELKGRIASERSGRMNELRDIRDIKRQLDALQHECCQHIDSAKDECNSAIVTLKQKHEATLERHRNKK